MQISETMMPALPSESRNLRPLRSTSITPTMVTRKFTSGEDHVAPVGLHVVKPAWMRMVAL